jgi:hypothetical protein
VSLTLDDTARWHLTVNDAAYAAIVTSVEITATVTGTTGLTVALRVARRITASVTGTSAVTAALYVPDRLAATITGTTAATVTLTTRRHLAASITGTSAVTCTLTTANPLHVVPFNWLISPDTTATVGMTNDDTMIAPYPGTVTKVILSAPDAYKPDGADFIVKVSISGTEIGTTLQRPKLLDSATAVDGVVHTITSTFDNPTFLAGDVVSIEVMQVGSTYAGRYVKVQIITLEDVS